MSEIDKNNKSFLELQNINSLLDKICRVRETNHIMTIIINDLISFTNADQGVINLVKPDTVDDMMTIIREKHTDEEDESFKVPDVIVGWVLKHRMLLSIENVDTDERFPELSSEKDGFSSLICCPMISHNNLIGVTTLIKQDTQNSFTKDDNRLVGIVTSQSSMILQNAILLEELARKNNLLKASQKKLEQENIRLRSEVEKTFAFENIIGKSVQIKKVLTLVSKVSMNDVPVLITGPTGTGKELIARAVHYNSARKNKPFIVKNCGVRTENLLESELFGHVKGAFTGADRTKAGLFKEADGGTIFLDEIGDAPLSTQVAILRVIENGEIRPVGSSKTEHVNVRIISATNRDLSKMIEEEKFRQDLLYRLNTITIELPPLAHRKEDIPLLVQHFLSKLRIKLNNPNLSIAPDVLSKFEQYSWPGNVRQLEHEIERAATICGFGEQIQVSDLSPDIVSLESGSGMSKKYSGQLKDAVEELEIDLITRVLTETKGNILQTSKILGLTRKGLKDKMTRYNIQIES